MLNGPRLSVYVCGILLQILFFLMLIIETHWLPGIVFHAFDVQFHEKFIFCHKRRATNAVNVLNLNGNSCHVNVPLYCKINSRFNVLSIMQRQEFCFEEKKVEQTHE